MMTKVNLLGTFSLLHPTSLSFDVKSPGEVIKALCAQLKGFKELLSVANVCLIADGKRSIHLDEMAIESKIETLDIVPMSTGSKNHYILDGLAILAGAVIIAAGIYFAPELGVFDYAVISIGTSLVTAGLMGLLFYKKPPKTADPNSSTLFNGADNMCQEGSPVPLAYGLCTIGSNVIAAQVTVNDVPV